MAAGRATPAPRITHVRPSAPARPAKAVRSRQGGPSGRRGAVSKRHHRFLFARYGKAARAMVVSGRYRTLPERRPKVGA